MNIIRNSLIVSLLVVLVLPTSFAFAAGIEDVKGVNYTHCAGKEFFQAKSGGYSGDDLYDSAADLLCAEASAEINSFSANPELSVVQRYAVAAPASAVINTLSVNTNLSYAQRYTEAKAKRAEGGSSFSANPELSVAQRNAIAAPVSAEINTYSANPELMVAQRYAEAMAKSVDSETNNLSASPELAWVHGSFSGDDAYDPSVLDVPGRPEALNSGSFSGDDNYDLAAGAVL